ncbi:uncharacterized protein LOC134240918 [Saccostrea cucullata]|uniref:uncharacterized protein LOC134240918 n=1 Tax=Saccostrea cuccullata TaxID=36930 RepID=UPI002ED5E128
MDCNTAEVSDEVHMQSAVKCDTCENTAEHLCKTCHDKLCSSCKEIHARSKSSFDHEVTLLTFESLSLSSEVPSIQICRSHPGFRANICCRECEVPVCEKCLVGDHNGHKLVATLELFQEKKEKMVSKLSFVESELPKYEAKLDAIRERQGSQGERSKLLKSQIKSHFEELNSKIEEEKNRLLEMVKFKEETELLILRIQESQMSEYIENIHSFMKNVRNAESSERNRFILYANSSIQSTVPETFPHFSIACMTQFSQGTFDQTLISKLCGEINLQTDGLQLQANFLEIVDIFAENKEIESLYFHLNDNTFWIYIKGEAGFEKMDGDGNVVCSIEVKALRPSNKPICASRDGNVFYRKDNHVITQMNPKGEETMFVDFCDQSALPVCMYLTKDDEDIAIGIVDSKVKEGKIMRFNRSGHFISEIQSPHLFRWLIKNREPVYIAENINGDICISSTFVDVFNKSGELRFSYKASGNTNRAFLSGGICTDILGHILIADKTNRCIHVLNIKGKLLKIMDIPGLGEEDYPITLTIDANYCLCVGCSDGRIKVLKYIA